MELMVDYVYPTYSLYCFLFIRDWRGFNSWVHSTILNSSIVCNPPYPPCDDTTQIHYEVILRKVQCWYFENWQPYVGDDFVTRLVKCDNQSNICQDTYRVCIDYSVSPPEIRRILISSILTGPPECQTEVPELPPENDPRYSIYWITTCFATPCGN